MKPKGSLLYPEELQRQINPVWNTTAYFTKIQFNLSKIHSDPSLFDIEVNNSSV
jgi:hypothetical protein